MKRFAGVLLKQDGVFVLQHRDDKPGVYLPGKYHIWGGAVEGNETLEAAAVRELYEETGVEIAESQLTYLTDYKWTRLQQNNHTTIYVVEIEKAQIVECLEGQGIVRVKSLSDIPDEKNSHPLIHAERAIKRGNYYSNILKNVRMC